MKRLSREAEADLALRSQAGDVEATATLVAQYDYFLQKCASDCKHRGGILQFQDYKQEATIFLLQAVKCFDPSKSRLCTWVHNRVPLQMIRISLESGVIRVPYNDGGKGSNHLSEKTTAQRQFMRLMQPLSLNLPTGKRGSPEAEHDITADYREIEAGTEDSSHHELLAQVRLAIAKLNPRVRTVVMLRMEGQTLKEIGATIGVTKERVRQIEAIGHEQIREALRSFASQHFEAA